MLPNNNRKSKSEMEKTEMKKLLTIALCVLVQATFGYKIGPRDTNDKLVIATWGARSQELAEEGRVLYVEINRMENALVYSKPNRSKRAAILRQIRAKKAKLRENISKRIAHLNKGRRLRIPGIRREPGNPDYAMSYLLDEMKRAR